MSDQVTQAPAAPAPSRNERVQQAIQEAVKQEADTKAKAEAPAEQKQTEAKFVEPAKGEDKSFDKLLKEKKALREKEEALKPMREAAKAFDPGTLAAIAKAKESGDPLAALAALGYSYADLAKRMAGVKEPEKAPEKPAELPEPVKNLQSEVAVLKQELAERRSREAQSALMEGVKNFVTEKDFPHVAKLEEHNAVLAYLSRFYAETGTYPAETFKENVEIAAQAVERALAAQAKKWERVLTPKPAPVTVPVEGSRESSPSVGKESTGKTLTNSQSTTIQAVGPEPKSREELFKQLAADPTLW